MRPVFDFLDYRKYLTEAFKERKAIDPKVSYRNLALSLGLDGSNLHKILAGQAHLPARCQSRILDFLGLGNREAEYFRLLVMFARERGAKARMEILEKARVLQDVARTTLEERQLAFYRDWWTAVVRALLEVQDGKVVPERLAATLCPAITPKQAQASLDLLLELGLAKKAASGRMKVTAAHLTAGGQNKAHAVHAYQRQILDLAGAALQRFSLEERDISTLTIPVDKQSFAAIRDILRECRRQTQKQAEATQRPQRVMQLAMAFFPVSSTPKEPC